VSRFARNSRDWQQLIEMCRVVDTVLVDQETIYAPRLGNDRLLLPVVQLMPWRVGPRLLFLSAHHRLREISSSLPN
jgi:hypothetical protein